MEWIKKLDPTKMGSFLDEGQQHQDFITGLLSSVFSSMVAMAAFLNAQDGKTNDLASANITTSIDSKDPTTIERKRAEVEANVTRLRNTASEQFEKDSPEHDRGNSLRI